MLQHAPRSCPLPLTIVTLFKFDYNVVQARDGGSPTFLGIPLPFNFGTILAIVSLVKQCGAKGLALSSVYHLSSCVRTVLCITANAICVMQNFILIAGAETRRTFAQDEERKYPGTLQV